MFVPRQRVGRNKAVAHDMIKWHRTRSFNVLHAVRLHQPTHTYTIQNVSSTNTQKSIISSSQHSHTHTLPHTLRARPPKHTTNTAHVPNLSANVYISTYIHNRLCVRNRECLLQVLRNRRQSHSHRRLGAHPVTPPPPLLTSPNRVAGF